MGESEVLTDCTFYLHLHLRLHLSPRVPSVAVDDEDVEDGEKEEGEKIRPLLRFSAF